MAETKLTNTKIPARKPRETPKRIGLLLRGKRRMGSFRLKHETFELLESIVKRGKDIVSIKTSNSDIIEAGVCLLSKLKDEEFQQHCLKVMSGEFK